MSQQIVRRFLLANGANLQIRGSGKNVDTSCKNYSTLLLNAYISEQDLEQIRIIMPEYYCKTLHVNILE